MSTEANYLERYRRSQEPSKTAPADPLDIIDPFDIIARWKLDPSDADVTEAVSKLSEVWRDWSDAQRSALLFACDVVAEAFRVQRETTLRPVVDDVSKLGAKAAKVGAAIVKQYPVMPWPTEVVQILLNIRRFVREMMLQSANADETYRRHYAAFALRLMREETPRNSSPVSWALVALLVKLAGGDALGKVPDESTIRRLHDATTVASSRHVKPWSDAWDDVRTLSKAIDTHEALASKAISHPHPSPR